MNTRPQTEASQSNERVHLEKCKICGQWINRLSLDDVVHHLDHSARAGPEVNPGKLQGSSDVKR